MLISDNHDTGYHELTDEEIVAYTRDVDGDEESEGESPPMVSHSEAYCALETVLAYLEQQPGVPVSTTVTINSLLVEVAKKRSKKQTKLQNILHMTNLNLIEHQLMLFNKL